MVRVKVVKGDIQIVEKSYSGEETITLNLESAKRLVEDINKLISLKESGFKCPNCHGSGTVLKYDEQEASAYAKLRMPDTYMGTAVNCSLCNGAGRLEKEPKLVEKVVKEWRFD